MTSDAAPLPELPDPPDRLTVRTPEDLIALVPVVIGFEPAESLTLLSFAARPPGRTFHARVDLPPVRGTDVSGPDGPPDPDALAEVVRSLADPVRRHRITLGALVVHSRRPVLAAAVAQRTAEVLARGGPAGRASVRLVASLRVHDGRWSRLPGPDDPPAPPPGPGEPFDVSLHPFLLRSVVAGRVLHGSRAELAATLEPDPAAVAHVAACTEGARPGTGEGEEAWARELVATAADRRRPIDPDDGARLLLGMRDLRVRDAAWSPMTRATAPRHVDLWRDLLRRAPERLLPAPGSLLAFAAWLAGDGALAWCALDRVRAVDPAYRLAGLVATTLERASDPARWRPEGPLAARPCPRRPDDG